MEDTKPKKNVNDKILKAFESKINFENNYSLDELKKLLTEAYKSVKSKKVKDENAPKREPSKYNIFIKEHMQKIKQENPTLDNKSVMKEAANKWKEHKETKTTA